MNNERFKVDIEQINKQCADNIYKLIDKGENAYMEQIEELCNQIKNDHKKIILISGPSSAGKTTTAKKIKQKLESIGVQSHVLNMDEFFLDADTLPLREDGKPDIENLVALDVECIKKCLGEILSKGETLTPQFDFATHKRKQEWVCQKISKDDVTIMEGIHVLNPKLIEGLDCNKIYKIYVHCNTDFIFKNKTLFHARQLRLLRRIERDERDRKTSIQETLDMWDEVCRGEDKNIRPFKETADYFVNSTHFYEPLLYKDLLCKKFETLNGVPEIEMFIDKFRLCSTISKNFVPDDSLLREFIGKK